MKGKDRYQLRQAAGKYWLLDMEQDISHFRAPIAMNETGAIILNNYWKNGDAMDAAKALSETYEIDLEEAAGDVNEFLEQLRSQGIAL